MDDSALETICQRIIEEDANRFSVALHRHGKDRSDHLAGMVLMEVPRSEVSTELRERAASILKRILT